MQTVHDVLHAKRVRALITIFCLAAIILAGCGKQANRELDFPVTDHADVMRQMTAINKTADELYKQTAAGDIVGARKLLDRLEQQITQTSFDGAATIEGIESLSETVVQTKRVFHAVKISKDDMLVQATKIRLATDALTHPAQPMWLDYYDVLKNDLNQIKELTADHQLPEAVEQLNRMHEHYLLIRPAVFISRDPSTAAQLDSFFVFLHHSFAQKNETRYTSILVGIAAFEPVLDQLFARSNRQVIAFIPVQPANPYIWAIVIGLFIIAVLAYVAWRKYPHTRGGYRIVRWKSVR